MTEATPTPPHEVGVAASEEDLISGEEEAVRPAGEGGVGVSSEGVAGGVAVTSVGVAGEEEARGGRPETISGRIGRKSGEEAGRRWEEDTELEAKELGRN